MTERTSRIYPIDIHEAQFRVLTAQMLLPALHSQCAVLCDALRVFGITAPKVSRLMNPGKGPLAVLASSTAAVVERVLSLKTCIGQDLICMCGVEGNSGAYGSVTPSHAFGNKDKCRRNKSAESAQHTTFKCRAAEKDHEAVELEATFV
uniref:Uncharacterized protein n=1 Tax=Ascaris lumbricoides TaxID=6252 RepID=A0A9J2P0N9_ASCLU